MRTLATTFCVWVAAITLAISVGGNLFQAVVVDRVWSGSPPDSVRDFVQSPYLARVKSFHTNPVFLVGLFCLLASPVLSWNQPVMRIWLLSAAVLSLLVIIATLLYFWPLNDVLMVRGGREWTRRRWFQRRGGGLSPIASATSFAWLHFSVS
jgi:hypothetical protein